MEVNTKNRINWVDYFKAIAIILVVIGHTTGSFNIYIYQFHMAAFFFISGYCMKWDGRKKLKVIWDKFYSLIFPLITIFCFGALTMWILNRVGVYSLIWGDKLRYIGLKEMFKQFFFYDANYVWWMGACWFLEVLFLIHVVHALLWKFSRYFENRDVASLLVSFLLFYFVGVGLSKKGFHTRNIDLVLIGQFFFGVGTLFRKVEMQKSVLLNKKTKQTMRILTFVITTILIILFSKIPNITVDYPSRKFEYYILNLLAAVNGIVWVASFAKILDILLNKAKILKDPLLFIGRNTIGVVFFHFLFFKLCYGILFLFGVIDFSYMQNFIPTEQIGNRYLLLFLIVSLMGSIGLWKLLLFCPGGKVLLGSSNKFRTKVFLLIEKSFMGKKIEQGIDVIDRMLRKVMRNARNLKQYKPSITLSKFFFLLFTFVTLSPLLKQGVTLNDELRYRFNRKSGYLNLLIEGIENEFRMGRPLRIGAAFNESINFITNDMVINKLIQIVILVASMIFFGKLLKEITQNERCSRLTILFIIAFMPITVEHAAPSAFIGLCAIPIIWLSISLIYWSKYIRCGQTKNLAVSLIFWVFSLLGYEYMVTYTPLYCVLYFALRERKRINFKDAITCCITPVTVGIGYIVGMFGFQMLSKSTYSGASVGFVSLQSSCDIIKVLVKATLPGYFLTNSKYQYLMYVYTGEKYQAFLESINTPIRWFEGGAITDQLIELVTKYFLSPRVLATVILAGILLWKILKISTDTCKKKHIWKNISILIVAIMYVFIPVLPNSIAEMYQGRVTESFFTSLPVSLIVSYTMCFVIAYILDCLIDILKNGKWIRVVIVAGILFMIWPIQIMNNIVSQEQEKNFERLQRIEALFETECLKNMNNSVVWSEDIFETYNLLAIHENYWNDWADYIGLNLCFTNEEEGRYKLFYSDDGSIVIVGEKEVVVMSMEKLPSTYLLQIDVDEYVVVNPGSYIYDNGFLCYRFGRGDYTALNDGEQAFQSEYRKAGNTLEMANIIQGYYEDGWVSDEIILEMHSGENGIFQINGYFPGEIDADKEHNITIYLDDTRIFQYRIDNQLFAFEFETEANTIVKLCIKSDFLLDSENGDMRRKSFILNDISSR